MNTDIRVSISFFEHRKTRKLIKKFGYEGAFGLLRLWAYAAQFRPSGYLYDMTDEDIAFEMRLESCNAKELVDELVSLRWLDRREEGIYIHDWHEHNPYASGSEKRSDIARFKRLSQLSPQIYQELKENGVIAISRAEYKNVLNRLTAGHQPATSQLQPADSQQVASNQPAPSPSPSPSPSPDPFPFPKNTFAESDIKSLPAEDKVSFDFSLGKFLNLNGKIDYYRKQFPAIDVETEIRKMEAWAMANPKNKKSNWERFIVNWLNKAQDRAPALNSNLKYSKCSAGVRAYLEKIRQEEGKSS